MALATAVSGGYAGAADVLSDDRPVPVLERFNTDNSRGGIRANSFIFTPSLLSKVVYDDNVYSTRIRTTDVIFSVTPALQMKSDWSRHSVEAEVAIEGVKYSRQSKLDHINARIGGVGKFDLGSSSNIVIESRFVRSLDTAPTTGVSSPDGPILTNSINEALTFNTRMNRWVLSAGVAWAWTNYENAKSFGVPVDQSFRNGYTLTFTDRIGYEVTPSTVLFFQPSYNIRRYKNSNFNSEGYRLYSGVQTELSRLLRAEVYGGYLFQDFQNPLVRNVSGFGFGGRLSWFPVERLTLNFSANRDIGDPSTVGAAPAINTSFNAQADYEIMRNLVWSVGSSYSMAKYSTPSYTDYTYGANTGMTYYINRQLSATASWNRTWRENAFTLASNYNRNQIAFGLKGQF